MTNGSGGTGTGKKMTHLHILIDVITLEQVRKLCTHKGDLTWHLQNAIKEYVQRVSGTATPPTSEVKEEGGSDGSPHIG